MVSHWKSLQQTAKLFKDIAKENDQLEIRALAIGGQLRRISSGCVAKLPTKDEAIAMLMSVMTAPVAKFVRTMNEVPVSWFVPLQQLVAKKAVNPLAFI